MLSRCDRRTGTGARRTHTHYRRLLAERNASPPPKVSGSSEVEATALEMVSTFAFLPPCA